jgi:hypothetical protein
LFLGSLVILDLKEVLSFGCQEKQKEKTNFQLQHFHKTNI